MIQVIHLCDRCGDMSIEKLMLSGNHFIPIAPPSWAHWDRITNRPAGSRLNGFLLCGRCVTSLDGFVMEVAS